MILSCNCTLREVKWFPQGHTVSMWWKSIQTLAPNPMFSPLHQAQGFSSPYVRWRNWGPERLRPCSMSPRKTGLQWLLQEPKSRSVWSGFPWLLAVLGALKSLLQHQSSKASILQHSAFFMVQLSHPYMTTGKTLVLTRQIFVSKVMSLLFNMLPRLVIAFLLRSKHLLISWLQSPSAVILEPKK